MADKLSFAAPTSASSARRKENVKSKPAKADTMLSSTASMAGTKRRAVEPAEVLAARDSNVLPPARASKPRMSADVPPVDAAPAAVTEAAPPAAPVVESASVDGSSVEEAGVHTAPTATTTVPQPTAADIHKWFGPATRFFNEMKSKPANPGDLTKLLKKYMAHVMFLEDFIATGGCGDVSAALKAKRQREEEDSNRVHTSVAAVQSVAAMVSKEKEIADLKARVAALTAAHEAQLQQLRKDHAAEVERVKSTSADAAVASAVAAARKQAAAAAEAARSADATRFASVEKGLQRDLGTATARVAELQRAVDELKAAASVTETSLRATIATKTAALTSAEATVATLQARFDSCDAKRVALQEQVLSLKGAIRVFVRVRPALPEEGSAAGEPPLLQFPDAREDATALELVEKPGAGVGGYGTGDAKHHAFEFQRVFPPLASQAALFEEVEGMVQSAIDGNRVCIFAYGQTGSGKTHTMQGVASNPDARGIIPRSVEYVFSRLAYMGERGWRCTVRAEMMEIYNEEIRDLLAKPSSKEIKYDIRHDKDGNTSVTNMTVVPVEGPEQVAALLTMAAASRATGATASNAASSRSHSVFILRIQAEHADTAQVRSGVLNLIDLAGSERIAKSGVNSAETGGSDKLLKETQNINTSLASLSKVIMGLHSKAKHISYRDSKLTYLLQHSLGGSSKTLMICNLNPLHANAHESLCTLRFAKAVAEVVTK